MNTERLKVLLNGVVTDTSELADIIGFIAEQAEWHVNSFATCKLPSGRKERSAIMMEADRWRALLAALSCPICYELMKPEVKKALRAASDRLMKRYGDYMRDYPNDRASTLLSCGSLRTLRSYVASDSKRFYGDGA